MFILFLFLIFEKKPLLVQCIYGQRSLNLDLLPLDPKITITLRRTRKAPVVSKIRGEIGDQQENIPENVEQPIFKNEDARTESGEQVRAWHVDFTTSLRDLFVAIATSSQSCIVLPPTNSTHFDIKPHVIQVLPSFHGLDNENPYGYVKKFKDIYATFKFQNFSEELVHLRLFPFSLHDKARAWLDSNTPRFITSWEGLLRKFYNKFFLMLKVNEYRKEIISFTQEDEKFSESWERFKDLLKKCPPHGYEKWRIIQFFYQGLARPSPTIT